jgi:hypothetical protein
LPPPPSALASALAPSHELEGWEKKPAGFYRAGQPNHDAAARATAAGTRFGATHASSDDAQASAQASAQARAQQLLHGEASDLFASGGLGSAYAPGRGHAPFRSDDDGGDDAWLPPFTVDVQGVSDLAAGWATAGSSFEVVATVVDEVRAAFALPRHHHRPIFTHGGCRPTRTHLAPT